MGILNKDRLVNLGISAALVQELAHQLTGLGNSGALGTGAFFNTGGGNLAVAIGDPVASNSADTQDDVLAVFTIPANSFDQAARGLSISAQGQTGATTNNKRAKIWINPTIATSGGSTGLGHVTAGTVIADTGAWVNSTTANSNVGWQLQADLFKYGAGGSNTQFSQGISIIGATHGGTTASAFHTLTEDAAITIAITGSSYTTGAAGDVILNFAQVEAFN